MTVTLYQASFANFAKFYFGPFTEEGSQTFIAALYLDAEGNPSLAYYGRHRPGAGSAGRAVRVFRENVRWQRVDVDQVPSDVQHLLESVLTAYKAQHPKAPVPKANSVMWSSGLAEDDIDDLAYTEMVLGGRESRALALKYGNLWALGFALFLAIVVSTFYLTR